MFLARLSNSKGVFHHSQTRVLGSAVRGTEIPTIGLDPP